MIQSDFHEAAEGHGATPGNLPAKNFARGGHPLYSRISDGCGALSRHSYPRAFHSRVNNRSISAAVPGLTIAENVLLTGDALHLRGLISLDRARERGEHVLRRFDVRARGPTARAESLAGGNLQKFIVGREVEGKPRVLLVNQPTVGVDVGAAARIRNELFAMRTAGCGVLVVSEELDELYAICDRLIVIAKGRASPAVRPSAIGVDEIGRWMAGLWPEARAA